MILLNFRFYKFFHLYCVVIYKRFNLYNAFISELTYIFNNKIERYGTEHIKDRD